MIKRLCRTEGEEKRERWIRKEADERDTDDVRERESGGGCIKLRAH